MFQKGIVHLFLLVLIVVIAIVAFLIFQGKIKLPSLFQQSPKVDLKTSYENPFKKETQYVNPFDTYKNPFTVNR